MSAAHNPEHTEQLFELLGGADPRREFARSPLAPCRDCARELDELLATQDDLESAARDAREAIEDARDEGPAPGERRVDEFLRRQIALRRPNRRGRWRIAAAVAALAAGLALVFLWRQPSPIEPVGPPLGAAIVLERPVGAAPPSVPQFAWRAELPQGGWYIVRVFDSAKSTQLLDSTELEEPQWTPNTTDASRLPDQFEWCVLVYDSAGRLAASSERRSARWR